MKEKYVTVEYQGDKWNIINTGAVVNGKMYCHLASTTRFNHQKNGRNPVQICDWIPLVTLNPGSIRP